MKVLPIKLPEEIYMNLKRLAKIQNTTMAHIIRKNLSRTIKKSAQKNPHQKPTFLELIAKHQYTGPNYRPHETDDEILYGGKLGDY